MTARPAQWQLPVDVLRELVRTDSAGCAYPFTAWVREHDPVHVTPQGVYLVSRHADGRTLLQDNTLFRGPDRDKLFHLFPSAARHRSQQLLLNSIAFQNPPTHSRLRRLVSRAFTARRMDGLRDRVAKIYHRLADDLLAAYHDGEAIDIHSHLASTLPLQMLGNMLGVPDADLPRLARLVPSVLDAMRPDSSEAQLCRADEINAEIEGYFTDLAEQRRRAPREDFVSDLVRRHDDDPDMMTLDELMSMVWGLWAGGFTTTATAIDFGVLAMVRHPHQSRYLSRGDDAVMSFVDELLRHEPPASTSAISRFAMRDVELAGGTIPAGSDVRVLFQAANRDPRAFPNPDAFDPARPGVHRSHLTFGHGIHYCLGATLARMQLSVVLPEIHRSCAEPNLAEEPVRDLTVPVRTFARLCIVRR